MYIYSSYIGNLLPSNILLFINDLIVLNLPFYHPYLFCKYLRNIEFRIDFAILNIRDELGPIMFNCLNKYFLYGLAS